MNTKNPHKSTQPARADWHPADIVAAVRKAGLSMRRLSASHGYASNALSNALRKPWPLGERRIAEAIGAHPEEIWPSRYADRAAHGQGRRRRRASSRSKA